MNFMFSEKLFSFVQVEFNSILREGPRTAGGEACSRRCVGAAAPGVRTLDGAAAPASPSEPSPAPSEPKLKGSIPNFSQNFQPNHQTLEGSFSAVSTPIFASKYSFCSVFRDLQDCHTIAPLETQKCRKFLSNFFSYFQWRSFCSMPRYSPTFHL